MPYLPDLSEGNQTRAVVETFGGYNHNLKIGEGEWYDETNLSSAHYPMFSQRNPRSTYVSGSKLQGVLAKDALAWVDNDVLYYNGLPVNMRLAAAANGKPRQLVSMGAYLCIFPDKMYFNTAKHDDCGSMEALFESTEGNPITLTPCRITGEEYDYSGKASDTEPAEPVNGEIWLDTSGDVHVLKQYSSSTGMWAQIPTVYIKIACEGIGELFAQYDGVTIGGIQYDGEDATAADQLHALNSSAVIQARGDDYIIIIGLIDRQYIQENGQITVSRTVPDLDFVCEANNRLWGCKYGMIGGQMINEIYACKQGDFKNWSCFQGISTDSYTVSVGSDGAFTGCIAHLGYPLFFKENCIHKLYGNMPSNYQLQTTTCRGVQRGSHGSLAIVDEILYYKSRSDICAYDGSLPTGISPQLGTELYYDASAGAHGGKYYVSMRDSRDQWHMFVYDTRRGVWHREDSTHAAGFTAWGDELFYIDSGINAIIAENGTEGTPESEVAWEAVSGLIGYEMVDHQYISRFNFRMKLGKGAKCMLAIEYDSDGVWHDQGVIYGHGTDSFVIPVIPQRCDHFRIRLNGVGDIKIYSIAKIIEQGSDA